MAGSRSPDPMSDATASNRSSPRPEDVDERQRSQDAALAQSMMPISIPGAAARTRSNTVLDSQQRDRDVTERDMTTRERSGTATGPVPSSSLSGSPPTANSANAEAFGSAAKRRGSVSAVNPLDHLADDLARSSQDDRSRDRPSRGFAPRSVQPNSYIPATFYRQQRNLSDSSIDSHGGAFIDHRRQQPPPFTTQRSGGPVRHPGNYRATTNESGGARRHLSNAGDRPDLHQYRDDSPPSPTTRHSRDAHMSHSSFSARTARPLRAGAISPDADHITTDDLDEDALLLTDEEPDPRSRLERHQSQKSFKSVDSRQQRPVDTGESRSFSNEHSRRGSFQPEEDVCFPSHGAVAATAPDLDLLHLNEHLGQPHLYDEDYGHHRHHEHGLPGVLHNYPIPFDFGALEEFAEREREGLAIPRAKVHIGDARAASGASPPPGASMGSSPEGGLGRRMFRHRKLSQSVAPAHAGRFQRNLAPFEGDDAAPTGGNTNLSRFGTFATILDTKTPLLGGGAGGGGGGDKVAGGGYGATSGGRQGSGPTASAGSRPYRFSFYSNALPSTIHARSLAEIPGEGQTFEELFVGAHGSSHDGGADDDAFSHPPPPSEFLGSPPARAPSTVKGSGTNTPNGAPSGLASSKGGGFHGRAHKADRPAQQRSSMMRTDLEAEANTWWLDVLCPTDAEMRVLSKVFGIHPLTTEDIQMEETREKTELFRNYYFVCFRSFEQDPYSPTYLEPLNMYIIVFREGTLSFHFRGTPHPQNVRRRIKQLKDYINVTSDWISYALIDDITDAFGPLIQNIEYEVDSIDELVLILKETEQSDMLRRIGMCRKKVMGLLRLMGNKVDVVKGLAKRCNENWSVAPKSDIGLYLSDIQDHITTSTQNLTHYEKILSRSHSNYLAQISIEMTDANNQINDVLSKLTALGTVLIPMNLITGLWGMNVHVPGQDGSTLTWFFGIIGVLGAIAVGGAIFTYKVFVR